MSAKWYVLQVYSGQEKRFVQEMEKLLVKGSVSGIEEFFLPKEKVFEVEHGSLVQKERNALPGYVFVKMDLTHDIMCAISSLNMAVFFLGGGNPSSISDREMNDMISKLRDSASNPMMMFSVGEKVKICEGSFSSFVGVIEEVLLDKSMLRVSVFVFGQSTPLELDFSQVEKIKED